MSNSARKPSGPTAMLVGIPKRMCWEEFSDFLDLLLKGRSIQGKSQSDGLMAQTNPWPIDHLTSKLSSAWWRWVESPRLSVDQQMGAGWRCCAHLPGRKVLEVLFPGDMRRVGRTSRTWQSIRHASSFRLAQLPTKATTQRVDVAFA